MEANQVDDVIALLTGAMYTGIVTLEIFSQSDLESSLRTIQHSITRLNFL
jgi:hypothetical protein